MREADQHRGDVRHQHGAAAQHAHVHERLRDLRLHPAPEARHGQTAQDEREGPGIAPTPRVGFGEPVQQRGERDGQQGRAEPVDLRVLAGLLARDVAVDGERGRQGHQAEPEQPRRVERFDDQAGDHEPDAAADAERGADPADRGRHPLGREGLADDPEREREDAAADALDDAAEHEHAERRRERAHRAAGGERQQHHGQDTAATEEVTELAHDRRRDRRREQVAGEDPRGRSRRGAELALDLRQGGGDDRLRERKRHSRQQEGQENDPGVILAVRHEDEA